MRTFETILSELNEKLTVDQIQLIKDTINHGCWGDCSMEFEENGEIVLVDYKTDRYSAGKTQDIIDKYRVQLNAYANAIEKITKKRVKSKYLYLFFHNDVVECN